MREYPTIGQLLDSLVGNGVYSIEIVTQEVTKYGFTYDATTDCLGRGDRSELLGSATGSQVLREMGTRTEVSFLDSSVTDDDRLVDGLALSEAILRLLVPGIRPRTKQFVDRPNGFRANVDAILAYEKRN